MALGNVKMTVAPGGGQQPANGAKLARAVVELAVCTLGTPSTLYPIGDTSQLAAALDTGEGVEHIWHIFRKGQSFYFVALPPSQPGALGAVTEGGLGTGTVTPSCAPHKAITIKCSTGGAIGTAAFQFSLDGGVTWSAAVVSTGSAPWAYLVPGTYCTLSFAAATYVATKLCTVGVDGTITNGSAWVGVVTQASSPIDRYEVVATVVRGGALGTATVQVSLDAGNGPAYPNFLTPSSGVIVLPGTGIVLTLAGTFTATNTYSFPCAPPSCSSSDVTTAFNALITKRTFKAALIHVGVLPSSAAGAIALAAAVETAMESALANGLDWQAITECPCSEGGALVNGDIVCPSTTAIYDTADTTATIATARAGQDYPRTSVAAGTHRISDERTSWKIRRPTGLIMVDRFVDTDPKDSLAAPDPLGPLRVFALGRDEDQTAGLDDAQINTLRSYRQADGAFLSITSGGFGWKNLTSQATYQDAEGMRAFNLFMVAVRAKGFLYLAQRPPVNADGTIAEKTARAWGGSIDTVAKRAVGLFKGGDFQEAQASAATATILRTSQLGQSPRRLDIAYGFSPLGFVADVAGAVAYSGVLSLTS